MQESTATYQIGPEVAARTGFEFYGKLNNTGTEAANQSIYDGTDMLSFSLSKDLGDVSSNTSFNALFAIGLVRDPSISFMPSPGGIPESRSPCFKTAFNSTSSAVCQNTPVHFRFANNGILLYSCKTSS